VQKKKKDDTMDVCTAHACKQLHYKAADNSNGHLWHPFCLQVRKLGEWLASRSRETAQRLSFEVATVTGITAVGMGDRACVDLCR
jgi:hypothetical protein